MGKLKDGSRVVYHSAAKPGTFEASPSGEQGIVYAMPKGDGSESGDQYEIALDAYTPRPGGGVAGLGMHIFASREELAETA